MEIQSDKMLTFPENKNTIQTNFAFMKRNKNSINNDTISMDDILKKANFWKRV